jgi:hypothetical protein
MAQYCLTEVFRNEAITKNPATGLNSWSLGISTVRDMNLNGYEIEPGVTRLGEVYE